MNVKAVASRRGPNQISPLAALLDPRAASPHHFSPWPPPGFPLAYLCLPSAFPLPPSGLSVAPPLTSPWHPPWFPHGIHPGFPMTSPIALPRPDFSRQCCVFLLILKHIILLILFPTTNITWGLPLYLYTIHQGIIFHLAVIFSYRSVRNTIATTLPLIHNTFTPYNSLE